MRFAYIDSNGNEVPIPSVDALALRIELGAIGENTELYDAQADQWGPAHTHEIFHSLTRAAGGEEGFVAPPPAVPLPEPEAAPEPEPVEAGEPDAAAEPDTTEPEAEAAEEPLEAADLGLTLADPVEVPEEEADLDLTMAEEPTSEGDGDSALEAGGLDLAPTVDPIDLSPAMETPMEGSGATSDDGGVGSFDFGDMGGGLELESPLDDPLAADAMDLSGGDVGGGAGVGDPAPDFSGGMELETEMDFDAGDFASGSGGALDLETPLSDFSTEAPPAWMEPDGPDSSTEEGVLDFSPAGSGSEEDSAAGDVPLRERRTPVNKPSKPKHRRERNLAGPIVGIVVLLAIAIGGYVAWPLLNAQLFGPDEPEVPPVFIPTLSAELMPQMRGAADAALAATFEDVRRDWAGGNPVPDPSRDWLAGIYLANASDFDNVVQFWEGMTDFLDGVRGIDLATFDAAFERAVEAEGLSAADAALVRERADSGFVAAATAREAIYVKMDALIEGALGLHDFLVANEANIEYAPATDITTNPVLEANPATPEISTAMDERIEVVTRALADLGYLDLVTAQGLWDTVLQQIQEGGIQ